MNPNVIISEYTKIVNSSSGAFSILQGEHRHDKSSYIIMCFTGRITDYLDVQIKLNEKQIR